MTMRRLLAELERRHRPVRFSRRGALVTAGLPAEAIPRRQRSRQALAIVRAARADAGLACLPAGIESWAAENGFAVRVMAGEAEPDAPFRDLADMVKRVDGAIVIPYPGGNRATAIDSTRHRHLPVI